MAKPDPERGYYAHRLPEGFEKKYVIIYDNPTYTLSYILPDGTTRRLYQSSDYEDVKSKLLFQLTSGKMGTEPRVWGACNDIHQ